MSYFKPILFVLTFFPVLVFGGYTIDSGNFKVVNQDSNATVHMTCYLSRGGSWSTQLDFEGHVECGNASSIRVNTSRNGEIETTDYSVCPTWDDAPGGARAFHRCLQVRPDGFYNNVCYPYMSSCY